MTLTVLEAAKRAGRGPETIRRWIQAGRLRASKVGGRTLIDERDLDEFLETGELPVPADWGWDWLPDGTPMPNVVAIVRDQRAKH